MKAFEPRVGVLERPVHRQLAKLAIALVPIGAAAVLEVAAHRVVVVAVDRGDLALLDEPADLVRVRPIADEISAAVDRVHFGLIDRLQHRLQGRQVRVDIGDDRDPLHAAPAAYPLTVITSIGICR
jgi:hypothetical protein